MRHAEIISRCNALRLRKRHCVVVKNQGLTLVYQGREREKERERTPRKSRIFTKVQVYFTCVGYFYEAVSVAHANSTWECYANSFGDL